MVVRSGLAAEGGTRVETIKRKRLEAETPLILGFLDRTPLRPIGNTQNLKQGVTWSDEGVSMLPKVVPEVRPLYYDVLRPIPPDSGNTWTGPL
jgi:hypothetical protein